MKKLLSLIAIAAFAFASPAFAAVQSINFAGLKISSPDTLSSIAAIACDEQSVFIDYNNPAAPVYYYVHGCSGTPAFTQFYPLPQSQVVGLSTSLAAKFDVPTGLAAQYVKGDGTLGTSPTSFAPSGAAGGSLSGSYPNPGIASTTVTPGTYTNATVTVGADGRVTSASSGASGSRTFNYPSRALSGCFQVSSTQDADVNYSVDITAGVISLGGGTGSLTSYTNSGCTTGAQTIFNGAVSSVALSGTSSIPLHGILPAGKWAKVVGTGTGGGTAAIDAAQAETLLP